MKKEGSFIFGIYREGLGAIVVVLRILHVEYFFGGQVRPEW